jgi:exonuclease-1
MGIENLLRVLSSITVSRNITDYKGKRIAIDAYCWLHKSVFNMTDIIENPNSERYLDYLIKRLKQLLDAGVTPVIVFDGDRLPMKKTEEDDRAKRRSDVVKQGRELLQRGQYELAKQKMLEGYDVNPQMAFKFIKILKTLKVDYIVAPYEADAQLAYLARIGYVDLVYTEDSDLIALGCQKVILKLEYDGRCVEISLKDLPKVKELDFTMFNHDRFLYFCILSGCDYFKVKGIGHKKAYQFIRDTNGDYMTCIRNLKLNPKYYNNLPMKAEEVFEKAFLTFKFQVIYCPLEKRMRYLNDITDTIYTQVYKYDDLTFLGR